MGATYTPSYPDHLLLSILQVFWGVAGGSGSYIHRLCLIYDCFSLQTNLGPVLIAVNSYDQVQSKTGLLQSASDNQRLQKIILTVTSKLANSSAPQVIVLR